MGREREKEKEREEAKELMKFKVTALECTSYAENRKRGRIDFPGKTSTPRRGALYPDWSLLEVRNYAFKGARLLTIK